MSNLSAPRKATERKLSAWDMDHEYVVATGVTVYEGGGAALNASGLIVRAGTAGSVSIGRATKTFVGAPAGELMRVQQGIFRWDNGGSFTVADRGKPAYFADDQTVNKTDSQPFAGTVYDVDAQGVWVLTVFPTQLVPTEG